MMTPGTSFYTKEEHKACSCRVSSLQDQLHPAPTSGAREGGVGSKKDLEQEKVNSHLHFDLIFGTNA